jgi:uncharacterized repeat protein (TIGR01451 family)
MRVSEPQVRKDSRLFEEFCTALLQRGNAVRFRVNGESMQPNLPDGADVLIEAAKPAEVRRGDVVLAKNHDGLRVHRIHAVDSESRIPILRSDTGHECDPPASHVFGKVVAKQSNGQTENFGRFQTQVIHRLRTTAYRLCAAATLRLRRFGLLSVNVVLFVMCGMFVAPAVHAQADLAITSDSANPTTVPPGATITYTIVAKNNGANPANAPVFTISTPANTTFVSIAEAGGTWNCTNPAVSASGTSTCTRTNSMASGNTTTFTYIVTVTGAAPNGALAQSANITSTTTDPNTANNTGNVSVTVSAADLSMTQTASPNPVTAGNDLTYTETVTNNGTTSSYGATLTQSTPANTTFVSATPPAGWTCGTVPGVGGTGTITCTATAALTSGSTTANFTIVVAVNAGVAGGTSITNSATVSETGTDPVPGNNTTSSTVTVGLADLQLTQTASVSAVAVSTNYTYSEMVTNNGPTFVASGSTTVYLQTPANTTFQAYSGTNWTCTTPAVNGTGPVICTYNALLASGANANALTLTMQVAAGTAAGTTILSSASVTNSTTVDPAPANNTSVSSIIVEPTTSADMALSMSVSPTPVFISSNLTYTIQVQNLGQLTAPVTSNVLTDTLPVTVTFVSVVPPAGWSCSGTTTINCSITSPMAMGTTATIAITVTAPSSAGTLTNTATVTLPGDPNPSNNSATAYTVVQPLVCATPGKDGAGGTLTGIVNAYYPPSNTGTLGAGSTSVVLGGSSGASQAIAAGDLLLIIQMQAASINSTNSGSYGDGVPGDPASGSTSLGSSGLFEFVTASNAVPTTGGTLQFTASGANGGLLNSYVYNGYSGTQGQQRYQVIRVPQYTSAKLSSGLVPLSWNGAVGGVLAIDVSSQLTLGGTVAADALGFRGAGGRILKGSTTGSDTDYLTLATNTANASKGEGIAGTPRFLSPATGTIVTTTTAVDTAVEGLPNGSYARGAPSNAGGGGTDGDPNTASPNGNDENSGGGGGGNGGAGGLGGYGWNSFTKLNSTDGGFGGAAFPASTSALVMGGGGGAGSTNNGAYYISASNHGSDTEVTGCSGGTAPTCTGIFSSGGFGGGIVIIHTGSVTGSGSITANGGSTLSVDNDSTGGGGAGGSILVFANTGNLNGLTVSANGGSAGNTWPLQPPGGFPGARHGPGGGGSGGVIFLSASPGSSSVAGGGNGYTDTVQDSYGATPGQPGIVATTHILTETPGTQPGAYCAGADLAVTNSGSPPIVLPGGTITYTQTVTNNGPFDALNAVFSEGIPANTTFQSISSVAGWSCTTPAVGATGNISCTNPDFANTGSVTFTVTVQVGNGTTSGTQIVDNDSVTSGTNDPNLSNNSAIAVTTVSTATQADLAVSNTASAPTVAPGSNFTMTAVVTNLGPAAATALVFSESTASNSAATVNATFVSLVAPTGWSCTTPSVGGTGTITCTASSLALNGTVSFPVVMNVPASAPVGTVLTGYAYIASSTPDPNTVNNTATASITVATAGQADLAVTSSGSPNPVTPGNNISYTQSITNDGPAAITASGTTTTVTFTDAIPANTTLASFTAPPNWTCTNIAVGSTGTVTCTLNSGQTLGVGAVVNFPLTVKVAVSTAPGTTITNSPNITSTVTDPNTANNTATVQTLVVSPTQADVSIAKMGSPEPVNMGTNLTYTLTVKNAGPAIAQNVVVTDVLPSQVVYTSSLTTAGTCTYTAATTTVSCSLGSLSVGSTAVITINVDAAVFSSSSYAVNTATVSSSTSDPNLSNNSSTWSSTIQTSTAVDLASFNAYEQPDGSVRVVWRTLEESRNLGFHVYREDAYGRHRIDPALIAGSALILRGSRPQHAAKTYAAIDAKPTANAAYWLEDVDINGTRAAHGPVYVQQSSPDSSGAAVRTQTADAVTVSPSLSHYDSNPRPSRGAPRPVTPHPVLPRPPVGAALFDAADHVAIKISVEQEGWYHVPFSQLFAAGLSPETDVRSLHLYAEGIEQPILLVGHTAGIAAPSDAVEFYGTGTDTPFSADRIYWLVAEGVPGKRVFPVSGANSNSPSAASFPFITMREDRTVYIAALLNGENNDNFFGDAITSDPTDEMLTVVHRDAASLQPLTLTVTLQGATDAQQHSVSVQFNGRSIGTFTCYGQILASQSFSVDPSLVLDGTNTVTLTALNGDNDISVVQSVQLQYLHTYTADSDWLRATAQAGTDVQISGFSNAQIRVFDITDPLDVFELNGKIAQVSGVNEIAVALPQSSVKQRTLIAVALDTLATPVALEQHVPAPLKQQRANADIVIVSYPDFASHLTPLVQLRELQGHKVSLVTTEQIFDDYNFGERSPFAIRSFLQDAATHWQRKPQAVLLVGDASMDPRNYLGFGDFDFVPTRIIETAAFKTGSDDWFTDFQQTGYATIPTGRLPVRTTSDVDLIVSKIVNYEQGADAGSWNGEALLVGDQNVDSNFTSATVSASASLPSFLHTSQIFADGADTATVHSRIISALNSGAVLVDYQGHGAEQQWSFEDFFDQNDAAALNNGNRLPVYLLMDCLNGLYQDVYAETLAKSLILAPNGGAVAVWASSGFTEQAPQASMNLAFINQFATYPQDPLGLLILRAKNGTTDNDVRRTWTLFGDPSMKFHFTTNPSTSAPAKPVRASGTPRIRPAKCPRPIACTKETE